MIVTLAIVLGACGGDDDAEPAPTPAADSDSERTSATGTDEAFETIASAIDGLGTSLSDASGAADDDDRAGELEARVRSLEAARSDLPDQFGDSAAYPRLLSALDEWVTGSVDLLDAMDAGDDDTLEDADESFAEWQLDFIDACLEFAAEQADRAPGVLDCRSASVGDAEDTADEGEGPEDGVIGEGVERLFAGDALVHSMGAGSVTVVAGVDLDVLLGDDLAIVANVGNGLVVELAPSVLAPGTPARPDEVSDGIDVPEDLGAWATEIDAIEVLATGTDSFLGSEQPYWDIRATTDVVVRYSDNADLGPGEVARLRRVATPDGPVLISIEITVPPDSSADEAVAATATIDAIQAALEIGIG